MNNIQKKLEKTRKRLHHDLESSSPLYQIHMVLKEIDSDYQETTDENKSYETMNETRKSLKE